MAETTSNLKCPLSCKQRIDASIPTVVKRSLNIGVSLTVLIMALAADNWWLPF
ncbi:hypothetical protein [Rhizobium sp. YS-1r]|uniref:hypothetical protein n=1 Tax=Rhizobium sp. YS-1r TaxID=1532558 RepID=UPI000A536865|nr:hypothetical protein [Rhizobium sp. YS-1r]